MTKKVSLFVFALGMGVASTAFASSMFYCVRACNAEYRHCVASQQPDCEVERDQCLDSCN